MIDTASRPDIAGQDPRLRVVRDSGGAGGNPVPWWLWGNVFSLEAPVVAVLWSLLFSRSLHIQLAWTTFGVLGLTVWVIYLADHVFDARIALRQFSEPARKEYFRRHPSLTLCLLIGALVTTVSLAFGCLDRELLRFGSMGSLAVALYLASVQLRPVLVRRFWPREAMVSALFVWGVCLPLWAAEHSAFWRLVLLATPFYLLCWMNCCLIECLDWRRSGRRALGQPNVIAVWLERHARAFSGGTLALVITLAALLPWGPEFWVALSLSCLSFQLVGYVDRRFGNKQELTPSHYDRLCLLLDLALMTPLPVLLWLGARRMWH